MASNRVRAFALGAIIAVAPLAIGSTTIVSAAYAAAPTQAQIQANLAKAVTDATKSEAFLAARAEGLAAQAALDALPSTASATERKAAEDKVAAAKAKQDAILQAAVSGVLSAALAAGASPAVVQAALNSAVAAGAVPAAVGAAVVAQVNAIITASTNGGNAPSLVNPPSANPAGGTQSTGAAFDPCAGVIAAYCGS